MNKAINNIIGIFMILIVAFTIIVATRKTTTITSFEDCVKAGNEIQESYPEKCTTKDGQTFTKEYTTSDFIVSENPTANEVIASGIEITGKARLWYFEGDFPVTLLDGNGKVMNTVPATAQGDWMTTEFVPYKAILTFGTPTTEAGTLVLQKDNPSDDRSRDDELRIPVRFKDYDSNQKLMTVKVFFGNSSKGAECEKVVAVERQIPETEGVAKAAILELLKGPFASESGYTSSIVRGTTLNSLTIKDGTANVDFGTTLNEGVAGSCMVGSIRAQIEQTLKQFDTIEKVEISVNGESEGILEP